MSILETLVARPVPLQTDEGGVIRISGTRVRLDTVITAFHQGISPEAIQLKYPSLQLTDIYAVITYYLWHQEEVDTYLDSRRQIEEKVRRENEACFSSEGVRERLLGRRVRGQ